jgi:hypothetical protein
MILGAIIIVNQKNRNGAHAHPNEQITKEQ